MMKNRCQLAIRKHSSGKAFPISPIPTWISSIVYSMALVELVILWKLSKSLEMCKIVL